MELQKGRTLVGKGQKHVECQSIAKYFWAKVVLIVADLPNLSPTHAVFSKTPHKAWFGMKQRVNHLRVFGCVAYRHIAIQNLQKLDKRAQMGSFVGYQTKELRWEIRQKSSDGIHNLYSKFWEGDYQQGCIVC